MTVEVIDGIRVIKLSDSTLDARDKADDMLTLAYLWQLLSGGHALRDGTVFERQLR